ncbi:1,2-phenylacetyl-CoA epoxidase subunit PaaC [Streptomyces griseiscabiei]|uniref:Phenylacetate-CoA oxygenase subunit PaaC n=1 Tax=Streptomyces griseiscabiei TaxID=2993540 RepID=A0ABU4L287_9ACTN|nr:1,2-phenylacetyl-CoA epoxidase subunit PaaC [Streptomyces griseiscabiei]MBZ3906074.1 phenylacetate-CoA oxygenase subunit PaaC [Streptomyces griseiscabiei]MDX2909708.1 phenylacetate-CoA oxygenase subunit PaaC [Streptomyces griseiscabiei]
MTSEPTADAGMVAAGTRDRDVAAYALRLGDDALILCQRLCAWVTHAPTIEEDLALSNIALDLLGHARTLLSLSGRRDGTDLDDEDLAYRRTEREFRNALLPELPGGDFAATIARQLAYTHYSTLLYAELAAAADPDLASFAARAVKDAEYHRLHASQWTVRLGLGTEESRRRMRAGLELMWPYAAELFEADDLTARLDTDGTAVAPARLRTAWERSTAGVLTEAGLTVPAPSWRATGGRSGLHTETFAPLLAELQSVFRQYPGGEW